MIKIGIIGGSGLEDSQILSNVHEEEVSIPYGKPTSVLKHAIINEKDVILISRHGKHHQYSPTEVNYRANLYALKEAGVTHILATTACGSLKEEIGRRHFVVLDQFIDFTKHRINTYADNLDALAYSCPGFSGAVQMAATCGTIRQEEEPVPGNEAFHF